MVGPWVMRLGTILFVVTLYKAAPMLAVVLVVAALASALGIYLFKGNRLPRSLMDVLQRLSDKSTLETAMEKRERELKTIDSDQLAAKIKSRVIGQDAVIDKIAAQLRRRLAATRPDHPLAVFCFAGATGTGKTYLAKVLVDELFRDKNHLHFFDMSQYGQPFAASSLFGSPRGYVGSQSYGALTAAIRDAPECVVLLDEFEKAHPEVHKRFLAAWNDGFVTEVSDGSKVSCNRAIFILTTNAAQKRISELATHHQGEPDQLDQLVKSALQEVVSQFEF